MTVIFPFLVGAERWIPAPRWAGVYEVSTWGRVRRIAPGKGTTVGSVLRGVIDRKGYRCSTLTYLGRREAIRFHRLVCEAFHGPAPEGKPMALHRNGVPADNRPENLYWGDGVDNARDSQRHGTLYGGRNNREKTHCPRGHEYTEENTRKDRKGRRYCRACRREDWAEARPLAADDPRHGTPNGYTNGKCRCPSCSAAYSFYARRRRQESDQCGSFRKRESNFNSIKS